MYCNIVDVIVAVTTSTDILMLTLSVDLVIFILLGLIDRIAKSESQSGKLPLTCKKRVERGSLNGNIVDILYMVCD